MSRSPLNFDRLSPHLSALCCVLQCLWGRLICTELSACVYLWHLNTQSCLFHFKRALRKRERYFVSRVILDIKMATPRWELHCLYKGIAIIVLHSIAVIDTSLDLRLCGTLVSTLVSLFGVSFLIINEIFFWVFFLWWRECI